MHHVTIRTNIVELLTAVVASMTIALLVLVGGLAIGDATAVPGMMAAFAIASTDPQLVPLDDEETGPKSYVCCAMIYADPGMSR